MAFLGTQFISFLRNEKYKLFVQKRALSGHLTNQLILLFYWTKYSVFSNLENFFCVIKINCFFSFLELENEKSEPGNLSQDEKERFLKLMEEAADDKETDSITEVQKKYNF